ncbi:hypothetical protein [Streptomyces sp. NPDC093795]|uniref:hypothetical protein n=1 Tax=Streptomyces sp. NPDC093795 TaxID=3366051 RepID=UPI003818CDC0
MEETVVCRILGGKAGRTLRDRARGIDPRTITAHRSSPSPNGSAGATRSPAGWPCPYVSPTAPPWSAPARSPQASAHTEDLRSTTFRILDAFAFQRARIRRITLAPEDLRPADEGPGTQISLDPERENRLSLESVLDRINQRYGRRLAGPASAYRQAS